MSVKFTSLLCLGMALTVEAHEVQEAARGLDVSYEDLGGTVGVNGMPITIVRAAGPSVPELAERLIQRWREDFGSDSVRTSRCCGWNLASRIHAAQSRVIQWRVTSNGAELLWSAVSLTIPSRAAPEPSVPMLAECRWSTPIHGRAENRKYLQVSAHCPLGAPLAIQLIARRLTSEGWRWQRRGALLLQAERGKVQAQWVASPAVQVSTHAPGAGSTLVLVESQSVEGVRP